jgi:hypothetical protein
VLKTCRARLMAVQAFFRGCLVRIQDSGSVSPNTREINELVSAFCSLSFFRLPQAFARVISILLRLTRHWPSFRLEAS